MHPPPVKSMSIAACSMGKSPYKRVQSGEQKALQLEPYV
jgi:hypothetical protein